MKHTEWYIFFIGMMGSKVYTKITHRRKLTTGHYQRTIADAP